MAAFGKGTTGNASLLLLFELFVALSLTVSYYFQVRNYGIHGDAWNSEMFMACSARSFRLDNPEIFETWRGRLAGMLLSSSWFDSLFNQNNLPMAELTQFDRIFGLYHACWLLLVFLTVICALRNSLLINLGIYAGLMYCFADAIGPHFYPWDLPAVLFFTLAVILYQRRQLFLMSAVVCTGAFFKETVLLCALLPFFSGYWKWWKKIFAFLAVTGIFLLGKRWLLSGLHLKTAVLSMGDATTLKGLWNGSFLWINLQILCTPALNHVLFVSAGTLAVMLLFAGYKRFRPYTFLIGLFVLGQMIYGTVSEFRIFGEVLPLSWILLIGYWVDRRSQDGKRPGTGEPAVVSGPEDTTWAARGSGAGLLVLAVTLVVLTVGVVGWRYGVLVASRNPAYQARVVERLQNAAAAGDPRAEFELGKRYYSGRGIPANADLAFEWLRKAAAGGRADAALMLAQITADHGRLSEAVACYYQVLQLDTNSIIALNNLAWLRATAADARLRNGPEAVQLAERACNLAHGTEPSLFGILAAAYAESGRFQDAVATARIAGKVALGERLVQFAGGHTVTKANEQVLFAVRNQQLLELYQSGRAYHETAVPSP
jgi:hypothetical protein